MPAPRIDLSQVPVEQREAALEVLAEYEQLLAANPLAAFEPHSAAQQEFLAAQTPIVAAFCGNQFGKSTILCVWALLQVLPEEFLPDHLKPYKRFAAPAQGWILCPTEDKVFDSLMPALTKWCPPAALRGGNMRKAFNGERMQLTFACGSAITFKTYRQDANTLGGATLHFVGYDEPPPRAHRDEAATRLLKHNGPELYAMTPLKSNTGWIRREIWRKREADHITVVKGSMHDNPSLSKEAVKRQLESYANDIWRRAREFGDFMDVAGLVYADLERCVVSPPATDEQRKEFVRGVDHVVGIDPGIRNAAFVFGGFDQRGVDWIYDEALVQNGTPTEYAATIDRILARWGLRRSDVMFVIDPAARQRSQATGDTVQSELARVGIYTINGTNDREAGQQQIRDRILHRRLRIFSNCVGIRDDADEFAWEMDDDDTDIGPADDSPFHRLATLRYQVMVRPWYPQQEARAPERNLGRKPNQALDMRRLQLPSSAAGGPMGKLG